MFNATMNADGTGYMFDWIFFAIILLPTAYLVFDWRLEERKNRRSKT